MIQNDRVSSVKTLGTGEFGSVEQGVWMVDAGERVSVAIKRISGEQVRGERNDFVQEASVAHSLDHEHIVRLFGVVLPEDGVLLVSPSPTQILIFRLC